ncbi:leucine-rich repeat protein [Lasius niger]|uniref:Leucine-rich repeat protein n=1 Tax=Lasius niger TaxID=67767 RepID=A0A0J7KPH2_LASNI|nr:leucine-rich repeat protein [Lasius niger]
MHGSANVGSAHAQITRDLSRKANGRSISPDSRRLTRRGGYPMSVRLAELQLALLHELYHRRSQKLPFAGLDAPLVDVDTDSEAALEAPENFLPGLPDFVPEVDGVGFAVDALRAASVSDLLGRLEFRGDRYAKSGNNDLSGAGGAR